MCLRVTARKWGRQDSHPGVQAAGHHCTRRPVARLVHLPVTLLRKCQAPGYMRHGWEASANNKSDHS